MYSYSYNTVLRQEIPWLSEAIVNNFSKITRPLWLQSHRIDYIYIIIIKTNGNMKIQNFAKGNLQTLRVDMDKALQSVANKYGITIKAGNASFSGNECTFKVKCNTRGSDGTAITKEAKQWELYAGMTNGPLDGLNHLNVGDQITIQGSPYILTGFNSRARKAPINFKNSAGSGYKCSVRMLLMENSK